MSPKPYPFLFDFLGLFNDAWFNILPLLVSQNHSICTLPTYHLLIKSENKARYVNGLFVPTSYTVPTIAPFAFSMTKLCIVTTSASSGEIALVIVLLKLCSPHTVFRRRFVQDAFLLQEKKRDPFTSYSPEVHRPRHSRNRLRGPTLRMGWSTCRCAWLRHMYRQHSVRILRAPIHPARWGVPWAFR